MRKNSYKRIVKKIDSKYLYFKSKILVFLCKYVGNEFDKLIPKMRKHRNLRSLLYGKKTRADAKALRWAKSNPWFGYDDFLTWKAYRIHDDLVHKEGVNPRSKKYYEEIDKRLYSSYRAQMKRYFSMDN